MRVPLEWLREYCDPRLGVDGVEERLTMTGTKVAAVYRHGVPVPDAFVVGRVLAVRPHPDADRLRVCEVDLGAARPEGPATIVCGAPNVQAGQSVAVARPGAVMPDGSKLRAVKLRGIQSEGMILAEDELGIGADHRGIMVLDGPPGDAAIEPGEPLVDVLAISTDVLELEVTPNRPDCLGIYGVARELHAATGGPLAGEPWAEDPGSAGALDGARVAVECPELCRRFTARLFADVTIGPSPPWLKARLAAAGQRPINNVVDITNYVMLLTGQPLHAFDFDRIAGQRLVVRRARAGETVQTLDGQSRALDEQMVLIADGDGPTSIAGLMGGARSEVGEQTTRVLLEAACWSGPNIHRSSWRLGLRSEASARFEKGLPPEACDYAQAVASRMLGELCGARVVPGTIDVGQPLPATPRVRLRLARVSAILGIDVPRARQVEILRALDFDVDEGEQALVVGVPPLRRDDVSREPDLIEEIARVAGLERLPATLPRRRGAYGVLTKEQRLRRRAADALVGCGLHEVMGWTFCAPHARARLRLSDGDARSAAVVELVNPLSAEHSELRTMLLPSLLEVAARNVARGREDFGLFELGTVFLAAAEGERGLIERRALGALLAGRTAPRSWRSPEDSPADFFALKAILEALGRALGIALECRPAAPAAHPFLHPGRAAEVALAEPPGDTPAGSLGWLGEVHPLVLGDELPGAVALELDLGALTGAAAIRERVFRDLISYPPLRRDLAVSLPAEVSAAQVQQAVREGGGALLEHAHVFDVYEGEQVGAGRRSLALALTFRDVGRTLSDEDVEPAWTAIVAAVTALGGRLRD